MCSEEFHYIVAKKDLRYDMVAADRHERKKLEKVTAESDPDRSMKYAKYPLIEPGSIVCSFFNLHNDVPSEICVSAVLTITTYGQKLYDDSKNGASFEEDFRSKVLHSYKSLLISELAQMYIRHSVNCGKRNPFTGKPVKSSRPNGEKIIKAKLERTMIRFENLINTSINMVEDKNKAANGTDETKKQRLNKRLVLHTMFIIEIMNTKQLNKATRLRPKTSRYEAYPAH